jgi:hypothetical protein
MELIGEEKRIPALFSEARLADEQTAPSFAGVWNRAQSKTRSPRAFNLAFVAATALLVCALVSLAWWARQSGRTPDVVAKAPTATMTAPVSVSADSSKLPDHPKVDATKPLVRRATFSPRVRVIKQTVTHEALVVAANREATSEADAIASWKSPTATLLDSTSNELLKSLPQLNQTADELKAFLPSQPK